MLRRKFLSLLTGTAVGSPLATRWEQENATRTFDEIEDLRRQLAEAQQDKMLLLSMLSEMRSPLNIVLGYSDLILDNAYGETPNEMRTTLHRIKQGGGRVIEMINATFGFELSKRRQSRSLG